MQPQFEIMTPHWLNRAHMYNGSIGPIFSAFRYRMEMDEKEKMVHAATYSKICYEKADDVETRDFSWDDSGVEEMKNWFQSQYEAYLAREASDKGGEE